MVEIYKHNGYKTAGALITCAVRLRQRTTSAAHAERAHGRSPLGPIRLGAAPTPGSSSGSCGTSLPVKACSRIERRSKAIRPSSFWGVPARLRRRCSVASILEKSSSIAETIRRCSASGGTGIRSARMPPRPRRGRPTPLINLAAWARTGGELSIHMRNNGSIPMAGCRIRMQSAAFTSAGLSHGRNQDLPGGASSPSDAAAMPPGSTACFESRSKWSGET